MRRVGLIICVAIILIQLGLLGYAATRASSQSLVQAPIRPTTQPPVPLDLEEIWPFASSVATNWRSDASLVRASMQMDWPGEAGSPPAGQLPIGGWIFMTFLSSDGLMTMRIDRGSGVIVDTEVLDIDAKFRDAFSTTPIDFSAAKTSSGTAASAAEVAYGSTFRSACPDLRHTSWIAVQVDPATGATSWHIEYESRGDQPQPSMTMDVDWQTADIRNVENATEPCP
jgi:hypothetical protein